MRSPANRERERGGDRVVSDVDALIQGYSIYLKGLKKRPRTVDEYTKDVTRWADWWKRPVEFFNQDEWDDWVAHLDRSGCAGTTIRRYQAALRRFFKYLRRRKLTKHDPSLDSETVAIERKLPVFLLEPEVFALIDKAPSKFYRAMFELLYSCGLRNEECRFLRLRQVSETFIQLYGKGAKERIVKLAPKTRAILDAWLVERPESEFVFPGPTGDPLTQPALKKVFDKAIIAAGIQKDRVTPHSLRHSIATHLAMRNVPVEKIQVFMGHDHIETTMVYIHLARQLVGDAILQAHPRA